MRKRKVWGRQGGMRWRGYPRHSYVLTCLRKYFQENNKNIKQNTVVSSYTYSAFFSSLLFSFWQWSNENVLGWAKKTFSCIKFMMMPGHGLGQLTVRRTGRQRERVERERRERQLERERLAENILMNLCACQIMATNVFALTGNLLVGALSLFPPLCCSLYPCPSLRSACSSRIYVLTSAGNVTTAGEQKKCGQDINKFADFELGSHSSSKSRFTPHKVGIISFH